MLNKFGKFGAVSWVALFVQILYFVQQQAVWSRLFVCVPSETFGGPVTPGWICKL